MRRHVQRVRRRRRDLRVAPRRLERAVGKRGHVVAVNDVVREPGVFGLLGEQLLEHRAGLQLAGVGLVGRIRREASEARRRSSPRRLRISRRAPPWRRGRPGRARLPDVFVVRVELRDGVDVATLTLGLRGRDRAAVIASRPSWSCEAGFIPAANGLPQRLSAMPQCAMAHDGSALSAASKASMARANSNEWSSATARSNAGCAAARQEVGKCTVPSFSAGAVLVFLCCERRGEEHEHDEPQDHYALLFADTIMEEYYERCVR